MPAHPVPAHPKGVPTHVGVPAHPKHVPAPGGAVPDVYSVLLSAVIRSHTVTVQDTVQ